MSAPAVLLPPSSAPTPSLGFRSSPFLLWAYLETLALLHRLAESQGRSAHLALGDARCGGNGFQATLPFGEHSG